MVRELTTTVYHDLKLEEVLGSNAVFMLLLRSKSKDILGRAPDDQQLHAQCLAPSWQRLVLSTVPPCIMK